MAIKETKTLETQEQKITIQEELQKLAQEEQKLSTELFEKYGKGNVDLDAGTITPVE